jgi:hypothetical protein
MVRQLYTPKDQGRLALRFDGGGQGNLLQAQFALRELPTISGPGQGLLPAHAERFIHAVQSSGRDDGNQQCCNFCILSVTGSPSGLGRKFSIGPTYPIPQKEWKRNRGDEHRTSASSGGPSREAEVVD